MQASLGDFRQFILRIVVAVVCAFYLLYFVLPHLSIAVDYPVYQGYVTDNAQIIDDVVQTSLEERLRMHEQSTLQQVAVLTIASLEGQSIEMYALEVFEKWGIGQKERNNGVLLVVARDDRKMRIEVGYGLEGDLTDGAAGAIIRNVVAPHFKEGDYTQGVVKGVESILAELEDGAESQVDVIVGNNPLRKLGGGQIDALLKEFGEFIILIPVLVIYLISYMARTKDIMLGGVLGGVLGFVVGMLVGVASFTIFLVVISIFVGLLFDWILSRNYKSLSRSGNKTDWFHTYGGFGGSRGFGGGGFGGFGGGRSGGGGASGGW